MSLPTPPQVRPPAPPWPHPHGPTGRPTAPPPATCPAPLGRQVRVLLIDADAPRSQALAQRLQGLGHAVRVGGQADALAQAALRGHDLVLVNPCRGPGADPAASADLWWQLRALRQHAPRLPVVVLHPGADSTDRTLALEMGADAVLDGHEPPRELQARIGALLRHRQPAPASAGGLGWRLDPVTRQAWLPNGRSVALSAAEYRLLRCFVLHAGRTLDRPQLMDLALSADAQQLDRSVDLLVSRLRRRLADAGAPAGCIQTVRGNGYRFLPQGTADDRPNATQASGCPNIPNATDEATGVPRSTHTSPRMSNAQHTRHAALTAGGDHDSTGKALGASRARLPDGAARARTPG